MWTLVKSVEYVTQLGTEVCVWCCMCGAGEVRV